MCVATRRRLNLTSTTITDNFEVIYRDNLVIAVAKPSGMIVHRGWDNDRTTVADIVRDRIIGAPVHAIHRLDRGTSGVLLFGLNADAARFLQNEMRSERTCKRYLALVRGPMREACVLDHAIPKRTGGRIDAVTEFRPLGHSGRWSLVEARPRTGRTHQIRHHLAHLSHPIVGDVKYGKGDVNRLFREQFDLRRLALHAYRMEIMHPDGRCLDLRAPLPEDLLRVLELLEMRIEIDGLGVVVARPIEDVASPPNHIGNSDAAAPPNHIENSDAPVPAYRAEDAPVPAHRAEDLE